MKIQLTNSHETRIYSFIDRHVSELVARNSTVHIPMIISNDAEALPSIGVRVTVGGIEMLAHSVLDLLWMERSAFAEAMQIQYGVKRVVKHIRIHDVGDEDYETLRAMTEYPSFRIALSASVAMWPELDAHTVNDVHFARIVGNYWAVIGNQTIWDESDEIKM